MHKNAQFCEYIFAKKFLGPSPEPKAGVARTFPVTAFGRARPRFARSTVLTHCDFWLLFAD
jgi:hypothetical protein